MKFSTVCALFGVAAAAPLSPEPRDVILKLNPKPTITTAEKDLLQWAKVAAISIFPNHTGWEQSYDKYMDASLVATFGSPAIPTPETRYNVTTFKQFFTAVAQQVAQLKSLEIEFVDTVAYPFPGNTKAGNVYLTGLEHGVFTNGTSTYAARDGLFAVVQEVGGVRKFTEWRESTNFYTGARST